jgi:pseudouridine-5'-phosphate glycosidase
MRIAPEVADALAGGRPVVALESTLVSHGLPRPRNRGVAHEVAATAHLAARAGIRVFATGGLEGVHRRARDTWDESADLDTLARTDIVVVCAGVKSILDVGATLERLETLGVTVLGYRSDRFAGFYLTDSGHPAPWRVDSPADVAAVVAARARLGTDGCAVVVANPLAPDEQFDPILHDRVLSAGLEAADREGVTGKEITRSCWTSCTARRPAPASSPTCGSWCGTRRWRRRSPRRCRAREAQAVAASRSPAAANDPAASPPPSRSG